MFARSNSSALRGLFALALGLAVALGAGCTNTTTTTCSSGVVCPEGAVCTADGKGCTTTSCGNGTVDPGEECDDGNQLDTDACTSQCKKAICGDNFVEAGVEACDPGTGAGADATHAANGSKTCNDDCTVNACGDGKVNKAAGEDCDSGSTMDTKDCNGNCTFARCGDDLINKAAGEQCDPPNVGNGCSDQCKLESCGNHVQDPGEICDNGTNTADSGCYLCVSKEICGNGYIDSQLTDNPTTNQACKSSTQTPPSTVHCAEVCDPPNDPKLPGYDPAKPLCSPNCLSKMICGNGIIDPDVGETCDPPNDPSLPGYDPSKPLCNALCQGEACGNNQVEAGEQCDAGSTDTAGCNGASAGAASCQIPVCGDGHVNGAFTYNGHFEECDPTPNSVGQNKATCNYDCSTPHCGDGIWNPLFSSPTETGGHTEQCDPANATIDSAGNLTAPATNAANCNFDCSTPRCGDGIPNLPAGEECDDAGPSATCNVNCTKAKCGDGIFDPLYSGADTGGKKEQCDLGAKNSDLPGTQCTSQCQLPKCGDGIVEGIEECDNGAANGDNADCTSSCHKARCGDGLQDTVGPNLKEDCESGGVDSAGCNANCTLPKCGDSYVNTKFLVNGKPEQCDKGASNANNNDCTAGCQINVCGDNLTDTAGANKEECDNGTGNANNADCTLQCKVNVCGDGLVDTAGLTKEACDPGTGPGTGGNAASDSAFCNKTCTVARCGDNYTNMAASEACDTGTASQTCNGNCTKPKCGDGIFDPQYSGTDTGGLKEQCDLGVNNSDSIGTLCTTKCQIPTCGDGIIEGIEECDNGMANADDADCTSTCHKAVCGDALHDTAGPNFKEACDTGGNSQSCNANCTIPKCGDNFTNPAYKGTDTGGVFEQCDNGSSNANNADCTAHCQINVCGDGLADTAGTNKEQCDDGDNLDDNDCTNACKLALCGDFITHDKNNSPKISGTGALETCDAGSTDSIGCNGSGAGSDACHAAVCGDGYLNTAHKGPDTGGKFEECDVNKACCDNQCQLVPPATSCM